MRQVRRYLKDRAAAFPDDRAAVFLPIDDPLGPGPPGASQAPEERRLCLLCRLAPPWSSPLSTSSPSELLEPAMTT
ncbi:hypothetical protein ACIBAH_33915 [Streptomyces sp. NPDC051445]|uniref:hypothetical protein n=1 Tax=Streptomyces sp. NPDC051445 TaxID=3365653 RepID=UPI003792B5FC